MTRTGDRGFGLLPGRHLSRSARSTSPVTECQVNVGSSRRDENGWPLPACQNRSGHQICFLKHSRDFLDDRMSDPPNTYSQWNDAMKNCILVLSLAIGWACISSHAMAQDNGLFSGQGVRFPESKEPVAKKSRWPKLLDFSKDEKPAVKEKQNSGFFSRKPSFDLFKRNPDSGGRFQPKPFKGFSEMFPKRDPNRPSMLQQMNTKSKEFFDRTTSWTKRMGPKKSEKRSLTWDAITKDLRAYQSGAKPKTAPAQPPVRTAEASDRPAVRF